MSEQLKNLKTALDNTTFKGKTFDEQLQDATLNKIKTKKNSYLFSVRNLFPALVFPAVILLAFIVFNQSFIIGEKTDVPLTQGSEITGVEVENLLLITNIENDDPSVILLNLNQKENAIKMIQIPHRVNYQGTTIEHVFLNGKLVENDFEDQLGIEIDKRIVINPNQLGEKVEEIGEVIVNNPFEFSSFPKGEVSLKTKNEVIEFVSMRKEDPRGIYGRNNRIVSIFKELTYKSDFGLPSDDIELFKSAQYEEMEGYFHDSINDSKWTGVIDEEALKRFKQDIN
ncbi:LCP family protein [Bacillus suaedaesalsae]|uniref:LCP family protein n=1 Tax=Bacillus suaedaesalsae TaxID=2810349 RepID=A0ABS2DPA8_9BACI|nr:LCP family protein [Bacillus suaedaesalsae]MBM6619483.1 LCP family protein [Bacillus suaedaesalsae]